MSGLAVLVDGAPLPPDEARAFWARFSAHLEAHRGDLAGFAQAEGFRSVHPETRDGSPVLVVSRTEPQRAYANAPQRSGRPPPKGGSTPPPGSRHPPSGAGKARKKSDPRPR